MALFLGFFFAPPVHAGIIDDLKAKITGKQSVVQQLDEEIKKYQQALTTTQVEKTTLTTELNKINQTDKQLTTQLKTTETKISATSQNIQKLSSEIKTKEELISEHRLALAENLRAVADYDRQSLVETLLSYNDTSELWGDLASLDQFQSSVNKQVNTLVATRNQLAEAKSSYEVEQSKLSQLKGQLADEKKIVVQNKQAKDKLLKETKNKETTYQQLLADRLERKRQVENEIMEIEKEIDLTVNPKLLPSTGKGILKYPVSKVIITQYFGNTAFASANPQVYSGRGHNGIDFGIPTGTPILAALSGTVLGTGDTDIACEGASYGKWILLRHSNGLTTLYAHLSLIKVNAGQGVTTGEVIGYSGNTGYSTGPHLHFTVFASDGVKIGTLRSKVKGCGTYTLPLGSHDSYLNPLSYL